MEILIFALFFFLLLVPLVLGHWIPIYKSHYKATDGIINYDSVMRKFVYKTNLSKDEIIDLLNTKSDLDELSCSFDFDKSIIRFSEYGSHKDYYFQVHECIGFSILRLEQVSFLPHFQGRFRTILLTEQNKEDFNYG